MDDNMNLVLVGNTDAQVWAEKFVEIVKEHPTIPTDEGTMLGWFANAIMAGYDWGRSVERKRGFHELIREIAFQAAGVGSGAVMKDAPNVVMPSEDITVGVNLLLAEFGVEGYEIAKGETLESLSETPPTEPAPEPEPGDDDNGDNGEDEDVAANEEPDDDPFDSHEGPLDDPEDAQFLDPEDPRRKAVERN